MKILLLPITFFIWFMSIWWSISLITSAFLYVFSISWIWIIVLNFVGLKLLRVLTFLLMKVDLYKFISYNLFVSIIHTLAGFIGIFLGFYTIKEMNISITSLWDLSWIKCLLFIPITFSILRNIILLGILSPLAESGN
jgi:hypothetical protein